MFITHQSAEIPLGNIFGRENSQYWRAIEHSSLSPWLFVEIAKGHWGSRVFFLRSVPDFEQLLSEMQGEYDVRNAYLVSPGYMTDSEQWSMQRLRMVCEVTDLREDAMAYQYTFDDGNTFLDPTFAAPSTDTSVRTIYPAP